MIDKNKILLISGTGQNVGKTTLVCKIIEQNKEKNIVAIKISPHFHIVENCILVESNELFQIYKETNTDGIKDSSKMLIAGAETVYYIQSKDSGLELAWEKISSKINDNEYIICESGGLRNILKPKFFIVIKSNDNSKVKANSKKIINLADSVVIFDGKKHIWDNKEKINFHNFIV